MSTSNEALLDMVERAAAALAKSHGLDFHEVCSLEADPASGDCDSSTCVAAWNEDHDASLCRDQYRKDARTALGSVGLPCGAFLPMEQWDDRDEAVLLLVDYRDKGAHAIDDATIALTIGHNNDHNVGDDEGQGWQFAGWCWSHDHYTQGEGKPIGWMPLPHYLARAIEEARS